MIELGNVCISQNEFQLENVNFSIGSGEYAILMGPTGCGKTTLIESICGLRPIRQGKIILDEKRVDKVPAAVRQIGYVPQDSALFPTMRVDHQILFGMKVRKVSKAKRIERLDQLAEELSIQKILRRYPNKLSGGEKQRVALARAIAFRPKLLCLDEPLSALDSSTHVQISQLLQSIHRKESVTILHITHNQSEARELGTTKLQFDQGSVVQV